LTAGGYTVGIQHTVDVAGESFNGIIPVQGEYAVKATFEVTPAVTSLVQQTASL